METTTIKKKATTTRRKRKPNVVVNKPKAAKPKVKTTTTVKPEIIAKKQPDNRILAIRKYKKDFRSISALKRYLNDDSVNGGKAFFLKVLETQNKKYKTNLSIATVTSVKKLKETSPNHMAKDSNGNNTIDTGINRYFNNRDGSQKELVSYWNVFINGVGRICKDHAAKQALLKSKKV